jgi:hypothetical protein
MHKSKFLAMWRLVPLHSRSMDNIYFSNAIQTVHSCNEDAFNADGPFNSISLIANKHCVAIENIPSSNGAMQNYLLSSVSPSKHRYVVLPRCHYRRDLARAISLLRFSSFSRLWRFSSANASASSRRAIRAASSSSSSTSKAAASISDETSEA